MFGSVAAKTTTTTNNKNHHHQQSAAAKPKPKHSQGRERLKHFDDGIRAAQNAIEDLEGRAARLRAIVTESDAAQRELQAAVHADGGLALAKYSSGQCQPDDKISKLVAHAKTSGEASATATAALPHTESLLQNARDQLTSLATEKQAELSRVIAMLADRDALAYQHAFDTACIWHDRLCGYASVFEGNIGDIRRVVDAIKMPRFALPSTGDRNADPYIRHLAPSELTVRESARRWLEIRARLEKNVDADIDDLMVVR